jgi:hypothetical protein
MDGHEHGKAMRAVADERYPVLLDPEFAADRSLLFEFVSPTFRIVLPYQHDDLILIGGVDHATLALDDFSTLTQLAAENDLTLVDAFDLPTEPEALIAAVHAWEGKEGVVARCEHEQTLVKLKGADYLARHRLRFALSARVVREVCIERDVRDLDDFETYLKEQNGDWELVQDAKPLVQAYLDADTRARIRRDQLISEVQKKRAELPVRKDFAVQYANGLPAAEKHAAFSLLGGNEDQALEQLRNAELDREFTALETADQQRQSEFEL